METRERLTLWTLYNIPGVSSPAVILIHFFHRDKLWYLTRASRLGAPLFKKWIKVDVVV